MALARLSTGEVLVGYSDINGVVGAVQVGSFSLAESEREKIGQLSMPLDSELTIENYECTTIQSSRL